MTPEEINEAVALKLGFELVECYKHPENGYEGSCWTGPEIGRCYPLPDYCNDIAAAWEIVEKAEAHFWPTGVMRIGTKWCPIVGGMTKSEFKANTAPMAICLALLQLK